MLIKYQHIAANLQKAIHPLYVLIGQDHYLLNDAALQIKALWRKNGEVDSKTLHLNSASDWRQLLEEANSYSLFSEYVLIHAFLEKKTIEKSGKEVIESYLKAVNPRCLIILNAPQVGVKNLQWLSSQDRAVVAQIHSFSVAALKNWISSQLQKRAIEHDPTVPSLIQQYTQGNMLGCAQAVEKIALTHEQGIYLTKEAVLEHLFDQCDYQLFELSDACLEAQTEKAIHLLRQARHSRKEPMLVLWLLAQEIRLLIQLSYLQKNVSLSAACKKLNIWPQRIKNYQSALSRLPLPNLYQLLRLSQHLDIKIKSNHNHLIWQEFERMALKLCGVLR